jgi:dipeptidyl aminopeptidase/acylaminoacyl peptidase
VLTISSRRCPRIVGMLSAVVAVAAIAGPSAQTGTPARTWTPELGFDIKRVSSVLPSPDGRRVAFVVSEAVMQGEKSEWLSQIHVSTSDGSGSFQLTRGDKSASSPRWSPDGRWIGFVSSRGGKANVWRIAVEGGEAQMITDEKGVSSFEWAPDGKSIAFLMLDPKTADEEQADKEKRDWRTLDSNVKMVRLYAAPVEKDAAAKRPSKNLTPGNYSVNAFSWAPDGRTIVFSHQRTPSPNDWPTADISVVEVSSGATKTLAGSRAAEESPIYSPDGKSIAFEMSIDPPSWAFATTIRVLAADGGSPRALAETPDGQPDLVGWAADGSHVFFSETQGVVQRLFALPLDGRPPVALGPPNLHVGGAQVNTTGTTVGFVGQDAERAPEAFVSPIGDPLRPAQVSHVQPTVDAPLGRTEVITWKSTDGLPIEGLLTYPADYQKGARVPLLVIVHGGPTGVFTRTFTGSASQYPIAAFAARGFAVLRCNVRGSSGYGRKFRFANIGDWGGGDYRDIMAGVDAVISAGVADPERLGVMGWSYGGYMTSWIITQTRRFKAASVGAGVTNLMSFTGTSDIPGFLPDYFGGEYWDVFDRWRTHSAMFNVKGVTTPTLIQHGESDDRVPVSQGYEFYNALKRQGVTVRMTVYPRQPHGFQEPKMTLDAARANLEWFELHVLGKTTTTSQ